MTTSNAINLLNVQYALTLRFFALLWNEELSNRLSICLTTAVLCYLDGINAVLLIPLLLFQFRERAIYSLYYVIIICLMFVGIYQVDCLYGIFYKALFPHSRLL